MPGKCKVLNKWLEQPQYHAWLRNSRVGENRRTWLEQKRTDGYVIVSINEPCLSQCPSRKYYFVVVQLAIEIYSLPFPTANGIKFSFIKMSDRDLIFVYLFCQTDTFLFVIETPIQMYVNVSILLVGTSTCKTWNIKTEIYYWAQK
jgi:hypothetical protein